MPIVNAAFSNWMRAMISVPNIETGEWDGPMNTIVSNFSISNNVSIQPNNNIKKGSPWSHLWSIGEMVWNINIDIPFLIFLPSKEPGGVLVNIPLSAMEIFEKYLERMLTYHRDSYMESLEDSWKEFDPVIESMKISISENDASLSISLISSRDPREHFYQSGEVDITGGLYSDDWGARICKPYDLQIPVKIEDEENEGEFIGVNCIGGPMTIVEEIGKVPQRIADYDEVNEIGTKATDFEDGHMSFVKNFNLSISTEVTQINSVGAPSAIPFIGIESIEASGDISYIPLIRKKEEDDTTEEESEEETSEEMYVYEFTKMVDKLPSGWMPDIQKIDEIRNSAQFYVAGTPPYENEYDDMLWVGVNLKEHGPIIEPDDLGPVIIASYESSIQESANTTIAVNFKTNVGMKTKQEEDETEEETEEDATEEEEEIGIGNDLMFF